MRRSKTAVEMLRGRLDRRHITVEERFGELPLVAGSPAQLNQVFLNLLVNAMQAIESTHRAGRPDRDHHRGERRRNRRRGGRQRLRHPRRDLASDLRSVLHDQGCRRRHGIGALDHPQHGSGPRRPAGSRKRTRRGHPLPRFPAGGPEPGRELILLEQARDRGYGERPVSSHLPWQRRGL